MAELPSLEIPAQDGSTRESLRAELAQLRQRAAADLRFAQERIADVDHLKRRLASLRRWLRAASKELLDGRRKTIARGTVGRALSRQLTFDDLRRRKRKAVRRG